MKIIRHQERDWVVRNEDVRFIMRRQDGGNLFYTEGHGGSSGPFTDQFSQSQKFWQTEGRWRDLHHRAHELAERTRDVTNPLMVDLNSRCDLDYWLVLSKKDRLEKILQTDDTTLLIPWSAFICYLAKSGDGKWSAIDIVSGASISGAPCSRRHAMNRASRWLEKRAEAETRFMLELYLARFREERKSLVVEALP
jgi:hypothetical protein